MRQRRKPQRDEYDDEDDSLSENLAAVNNRLDDLSRQLERVTRTSSRPDDERRPDLVSEAIAKLDRRLDQVIAEGRAQAREAERRVARMPPPPPPAPPPPPSGPANWAMEISARQRMLDGDPAPARATHNPRAPGQDLSGLEHHLREITSQIASLHQPYEDALTALRGDLAEIGRALTEALPRRAVEALETEVRSLADRVDRTRGSSSPDVDKSLLSGLEQGLAEVRDALRHLTPAESLAGVDEAVRGLSRKIDQISAGGGGGHDAGAFQQIEQAIGSLRSVVSNVASDGALEQLAAEVRSLATKFEHTAYENNSSGEALARLDQRISVMMESGRALPPELEASIRSLSDQLERSQLSRGDQLALGSLEDRIVQLFEKLDASEARLGSLAAIERGMADLLVAVEDIRGGNNSSRGPRSHAAERPEPAPAAPPSLPPAPQFESPPAYVAPPPPPPPPPPQVAPPPLAAQAPSRPPPGRPEPPQPRRPIDPNLPADTPLEPGSGQPRIKPGSPAERIAASEAALSGTRRPEPEAGGKTAAVAAARSAAKVQADAPAAPAPAQRAKPKSFELTEEDLAVVAGGAKPAFRGQIVKHVKTLLIAASVVAIVLGTVNAALEFLWPSDASQAPISTPAATPDAAPTGKPEERTPPATVPSRPMPAPEGSLPPAADSEPRTTGQIGRSSQMFDPATILKNLPKLPSTDITGSVPRPSTPRPAAASAAPASPAQTVVASLPASISPVLRTAAGNGEPGAEYEIGIRYVEGRGVPQSFEEASRWFDRAAKTGFAPAQFRLASLHEKGEGVKKDLQAARKLYVAAAEKGHAKAMHNIAVLYAEGIDGKPDYRMAAQWFRRAAAYGVSDSQFNLAILYARGIGVEQNLGESFKWFALAAAKGDQDATKKRDDVAARLDRSSLMAARLAAQTFTAEREPEEATNLRTPPGGWDRHAATVQPMPARPKARAPVAPQQ